MRLNKLIFRFLMLLLFVVASGDVFLHKIVISIKAWGRASESLNKKAIEKLNVKWPTDLPSPDLMSLSINQTQACLQNLSVFYFKKCSDACVENVTFSKSFSCPFGLFFVVVLKLKVRANKK